MEVVNFVTQLAGAFNPFEKYYWFISPKRNKNNNYLKAPPRQPHDFRFLSKSKKKPLEFVQSRASL